jgi:predicted MPP superfamily phosphohydrolase
MLVFALVLLAVLGTAWTVVGLVLAPLVPGGWVTIAVAALLGTVMPFGLFIADRLRGHAPGRIARLYFIRPFWYVQLFLLLTVFVSLPGAAVGFLFGTAIAGAQVAVLVTSAIAAIGVIAGYKGSRRLERTALRVEHPDLPDALEGAVIAQLTDLHVGPHTGVRRLQAARRITMDAHPDLIAVTGDLVDDFTEDLAVYERWFGDFAAPLGVYVSPGNHDVYAGWDEMRRHLERLPLHIVSNASVTVSRGGATLAIVGTGDPAGAQMGSRDAAPDLDRAVLGVPAGAFVLALAHNPALWPGCASRGAHLTLSGHTHWGQFAIPSRHWCLASPFNRFVMGAYAAGHALLYVAPGTNYWGIPFRIGCPSEVTILTLRRGPVPRVVPDAAPAP